MEVIFLGYRDERFKKEKSNYGWYTCAQCGKKGRKSDMDVDHIFPKSKGGPNSTFNTQLLCQSCNRSKGAKVDSRVVKGYANKVKGLFRK